MAAYKGDKAPKFSVKVQLTRRDDGLVINVSVWFRDFGFVFRLRMVAETMKSKDG